jgi:hypothetical protein
LVPGRRDATAVSAQLLILLEAKEAKSSIDASC